ncbi:MAG: hypothetical protein A4E64_01695 [Syntrophorhabdus sp. PtaU1.Bin058]|nr:MAG: hypothetical protein A4E64_01695 [Syntrophorhabdus sp. PtaU1.Bin058]
MKRSINLTIDTELHRALEGLPRRVSVSEVTNYLLMCYMAMFAKCGLLTESEVDKIIEKCGGEDFRKRVKETFLPAVDKIGGVENLNKLFGWAVRPDKEKRTKRNKK